jgi:hypothetical protein
MNDFYEIKLDQKNRISLSLSVFFLFVLFFVYNKIINQKEKIEMELKGQRDYSFYSKLKKAKIHELFFDKYTI